MQSKSPHPVAQPVELLRLHSGALALGVQPRVSQDLVGAGVDTRRTAATIPMASRGRSAASVDNIRYTCASGAVTN
jgi:hypothetical protein